MVKALKKRYDRPHKTRAMLHKQLQQLPQAGQSGVDLRTTWLRISGILRGLRKHEDFRTVLPILDLVRSKFPTAIQQKLHDVEFQSGTDFDLHQIMHHLDHIIASREKHIVHEKNADDTVHVGTILIGRADTTMIATGGITAHRRGTDTRLEVHLMTDAEAEAIPTVSARGPRLGMIVVETIDHGLTLRQGVIVTHPTGFTSVRHAETAVTIAP
ncbi:unnamed protein product [Haemonchus placei]|uniref:Uncharacterized protein n=1 Tax=Haemonchus placei TaxID=6290 RepID=A0A3P8CLV4_HAEPC|nr:unnamed protein product [Haemonchus placei]